MFWGVSGEGTPEQGAMSVGHRYVAAMLLPDSGERRCRDCDEPLSTANMYPSCVRHSQWVCKACWNGRFYLAVKKHRYGLTEDQFIALCEAQDWKCAICAKALTQRAACVDHDHATLAVRGVLCKKCNSGLGMFCDDELLLEKALEYMRRKRAESK